MTAKEVWRLDNCYQRAYLSTNYLTINISVLLYDISAPCPAYVDCTGEAVGSASA